MTKSQQPLPITIFWFRRDLRLHDNHGLFLALKENKNVLPIFIFDANIVQKLEDPYDRRVDFIHQALQSLQTELKSFGSDLKCMHDTPIEAFRQLASDYRIDAVYCNYDYEAYAIERDAIIKELLHQHHIPFHTFKDQVIFEKNEVVKDDGKPYTVFTPFSRKWKARLSSSDYAAFDTIAYSHHFYKTAGGELPDLKTLGFVKTDIVFNKAITVSTLLLEKYKSQRDIPSLQGTSKLSVYLRFGIVSIRELVRLSLPVSETWLNELIWREFYMMILWHFPHVGNKSFKPNYDRIQWLQDEQGFKKWCEGKTGFAMVDAGMRELNETGFMHNRVRMIVSSFLVKDLLIDWRWGEAYFAKKLNDFDLSANNGGWQWAAGCGCDAAPYFRIFNPTEQQKKFDPDFKYIKQWIPEFGSVKYPSPIVDHDLARKRALNHYKRALTEHHTPNLFETLTD
ncbi:MAG: deoxyribodipyrimidine photo-lyase [Bacteroidota bacterium]